MPEDLDLERLRSADPATYKEYMLGMIDRGSGISAKLVMTSVQKAWLQWVIQKACQARGWTLYQFQSSEKRIVMIRFDKKTYRVTSPDRSMISVLLSVYLVVLDDEKAIAIQEKKS